jgi:hypothetical protein
MCADAVSSYFARLPKKYYIPLTVKKRKLDRFLDPEGRDYNAQQYDAFIRYTDAKARWPCMRAISRSVRLRLGEACPLCYSETPQKHPLTNTIIEEVKRITIDLLIVTNIMLNQRA